MFERDVCLFSLSLFVSRFMCVTCSWILSAVQLYSLHYHNHHHPAPPPPHFAKWLDHVLSKVVWCDFFSSHPVQVFDHSRCAVIMQILFYGNEQSVLFEQEVNEVVQKVSGSDQPLRLWSDEDRRVIETPRDTLLYSFSIRLKVTLKNTFILLAVWCVYGLVCISNSLFLTLFHDDDCPFLVHQKTQGKAKSWHLGGGGGIQIGAKRNRWKCITYASVLSLQGIQITATTPTSNAVRFETGEITLDLSNRVQISSKDTNSDNGNRLWKWFEFVMKFCPWVREQH